MTVTRQPVCYGSHKSIRSGAANVTTPAAAGSRGSTFYPTGRGSSSARKSRRPDEAIGGRRRWHVHRPHLPRRRGRRPRAQGAVDAGRPVHRDRAGCARALRDCRGGAGRDRPVLPRHHRRDEHHHRAQRRRGRSHHDQGLPGHHPHRAAQEAAQLVELPGPAVAAVPARAAPSPDAGDRARHRAERGRARAARRGRGPRRRSVAESRRSRVDRGLLPLLLPQRRAREAGEGDRARGVSRGVPLGAARGLAAVPRVRGLLDGLPERLRRAEGEPLRARPGRGDAGARLRGRASPDDLRGRRDDRRERGREARLDTVLRAGGGSDRRHLGRANGRHAERHLARRRRHVRGHRGRAERRGAHAPPARYEGRRLPRHDPDGRDGRNRRGWGLDRLRRRRRDLPGRAAQRGRRSGPCLLRPRRRGAGGHGLPARARPDPGERAPRRSAAARPGCGTCGHRDEPVPQARHDGRGGRAVGAQDPDAHDGAGHRGELGAPRLRPARLHPRRLRRRRAPLRLRYRAGARDPARRRAAAPGHHVRDGPARDERRVRLREDGDGAAARSRSCSARSRLRRARSPGGRAAGAGRLLGRLSPARAIGRLPLRRPGLRAADPAAAGAGRRRLARAGARDLPRAARAALLPPLRRSPDPARQHPLGRGGDAA